MLAESDIVAGDLLLALNSADVVAYHYLPDRCKKIAIYSRFSKLFVRPLFTNSRLTIRSVNKLNQPELLVAVVHLPDKRFFKEDSQFAEAIVMANYI